MQAGPSAPRRYVACKILFAKKSVSKGKAMPTVIKPTPKGHRTSRRDVCLGFQTALRALRCLSAGEVANARRNRLPPLSPPRQEDIARAALWLSDREGNGALMEPLHVLHRSTTRCRRTPLCHPHTAQLDHPASSFIKIEPGLLCACAPLAFVQEAARLSFIELLQLGYEICGTYQRAPGANTTRFQTAPLTNCSEIRSFLRRSSNLNGTAKAARAAAYIADQSASPRETQAAILLGLPARMGGYALGMPRMNCEIEATKAAVAIAGRRSFRCDLCWPEHKVDVEYQSREYHTGETSRIRDSRRTNALLAMGYTVIAITNDELDSQAATDVIAQSIRSAIGKRPRPFPNWHRERNTQLRRLLGLPA